MPGLPELPLLDSPDWFRAQNLSERSPSGASSGTDLDADLAQQRLAHWRSEGPLADDSIFAHWLELHGLDEEKLLVLLGEPSRAVAERYDAPPPWLETFRQAFRQHPEEEYRLPVSFTEDNVSPPLESPRGDKARFLWLAAPLIRRADERLRATVRELTGTHSSFALEPAEALLLAELPDHFEWLLGRTVALELHIGQLEGTLEGATPQERFEHFFEQLKRPEDLLEVLASYPVLARLLTRRLEDWAEARCELLRRLSDDWPALCRSFMADADPGPLVATRTRLGDPHRGGRSVGALFFAGGHHLIYKPRPLALAAHFQDLLVWLNARGQDPPFRPLTVLDCGDYGWVEHVEAGTCTNEDEIRRFYERQGAYLALLHAFGAVDFHYENLIAVGEHPILIDLESIFQPRNPTDRSMRSIAVRMFRESVLSIGLLPLESADGPSSALPELSGLGGHEGQLTSRELPYLEGMGTDTLEVRRKRIELVAARNRPTLHGAAVSLFASSSAITTGFERLYRLLLENRHDLLADDGPFVRFRDDKVRIIVRPTRVYGRLLQESYHPHLFGDAVHHQNHFDRLWLAARDQEELRRLVPIEIEALQAGDIPLFEARLDGHDLECDGGRRRADFFPKTGFEQVRERLEGLSENDLERQTSLIRGALVAYSFNRGEEEEIPTPTPAPAGHVGPERLVEAARRIGDRLETLAFRADGQASWMGLRQSHIVSLIPLGTDFYDGLPGCIFFLAYLGDVTGEERYTVLAREALENLQRQLAAPDTPVETAGAYMGWGGLIYAFTHLGRLWGDGALLGQAESFVEHLPGLIEHDESPGIIGGSAGCLVSLLGLAEVVSSPRVLEMAVRCGERLVVTALDMEPGVAWPPPPQAERPLAGFAHGVAGIAWALVELAAATDESRFQDLARRGLDYERTLFVSEAGNWRDLRSSTSGPVRLGERVGDDVFMTAWCHGAPGIGLGRIRMLRHLDDPRIRDEVDAALETTLKARWGVSHCLCHGDLGNLELLLQAEQTLEKDTWRPHVERLAGQVLADLDADWRTGLPMAAESPGLMSGLAGLGYGLLRLAHPERVPAVLLLDAPNRDRDKFIDA